MPSTLQEHPMGFMSAYDGTHRIVIPHPDGDYWVELKKHLSHGAAEKATAALQGLEVVDGKARSKADIYKSQLEKVLASIVAWNLDDDNGTVWPVNQQSLRRLPDSVFDLLFETVEKSNAPEGRAERTRFPAEDDGGDPVGDAGASESGDVPDGAGAVEAPWAAA
jgi:hypothetical protein